MSGHSTIELYLTQQKNINNKRVHQVFLIPKSQHQICEMFTRVLAFTDLTAVLFYWMGAGGERTLHLLALNSALQTQALFTLVSRALERLSVLVGQTAVRTLLRTDGAARAGHGHRLTARQGWAFDRTANY